MMIVPKKHYLNRQDSFVQKSSFNQGINYNRFQKSHFQFDIEVTIDCLASYWCFTQYDLSIFSSYKIEKKHQRNMLFL